MPLREYKCLACGQGEERQESWEDQGPMRCPYCRATAYHRVIHAPLFHVKGGGDARMVGGERPFTKERVVTNPDGSETKYSSLHEARRGEYERAAAVTPNGLAKTLLARSNARRLASGVMPGRDSTKYREACEEAPR